MPILTTIVSYDNGYDDASRSLTVVSCSDGPNGLITKYGWQNQGAIARFPHIGGYMGVEGWNSAQVGHIPVLHKRDVVDMLFHSVVPVTV
jgi:hypothetical protein